MADQNTGAVAKRCGVCRTTGVPLYLAVWGNPVTGESGETFLCGRCGERPDDSAPAPEAAS